MSEVGKQLVEGFESLAADMQAIPEGVSLLEGLAAKGYCVTFVSRAERDSEEENLEQQPTI